MSQDDFSLFEFFNKYPDEESAKIHFEQTRWKGNITCPHCKSSAISLCGNPMPYRCKDCRKHFSVRTGSILRESKLPLHTWLLAMYILTTSKKGISSVQLAKHLGCTQKTAWFLAHKICEIWLQSNEKLIGTVEVDEVYIGGQKKNKHASKNLKAGRGAVGKIAVVCMLERSGEVKDNVVQATDTQNLTSQINNNVKVGTNIYTDCYRAYRGLSNYNYRKVKHSVDEFARRHNINKLKTLEKIEKTINNGIGIRLTYKRLINVQTM